MTDYTGNSKRGKEEKQAPPKKEVTTVVTGEVVARKKSLGSKFKGLVAEADIRSVVNYVVSEVLIPAARNMIVDASSKGVERMMYGETATQRRYSSSGPRVTYNNPIGRGYSTVPARRPPEPRTASRSQDDFIVSSRGDADEVIGRMNDIIDTYEVASVADLKELLGLPSTHTDNKWGWIFLGDLQARQVREGWLLELPPAEHLQS